MSSEPCTFRNETNVALLLEKAKAALVILEDYLEKTRVAPAILELGVEYEANAKSRFERAERFYEIVASVKRALDFVANDIWEYLGRPESVRERDVAFPIIRNKAGASGAQLDELLVRDMVKKQPGLFHKNPELFRLLLSIQPHESRFCNNSRYWLDIIVGEFRNISEHRHIQPLEPQNFQIPVSNESDSEEFPCDCEVSDEYLAGVPYSGKLPVGEILYMSEEKGGNVTLTGFEIEGLNCDPLVLARIIISETAALCSWIYRLLRDPDARLPVR